MTTKTARLTTRKWWDFVYPLQNTRPFVTGGALLGATTVLYGSGILTGDHLANFRTMYNNDTLAYVVYSYQTPIAWRSTDGVWYVPDFNFSVTTKRHQRLIKTALNEAVGEENVHFI